MYFLFMMCQQNFYLYINVFYFISVLFIYFWLLLFLDESYLRPMTDFVDTHS